MDNLFTEIYCADPSGGADNTLMVTHQARSSTGLFQYGTVLTYSCLDGRRFDDGQYNKTTDCVDVDIWNETSLSCECKYLCN